MGKKYTIAVDLDGVLAHHDGWKGLEVIGEPLPGARDFLLQLKNRGKVIIFTCRGNSSFYNETKESCYMVIRDWLDKYNMPFDDIYTGTGKPLAVAYIDDRGVTCRPQYEEVTGEAYKTAVKWVDHFISKKVFGDSLEDLKCVE